MADLEDILARLQEQVDGCLVAAVAGLDGLIIERHPQDGPDLAGVVAEITSVLANLTTALTDQLGGGPLQEVIVTSERRTAYARLLGGELFCLLVLGRRGNLGKARLHTSEAAKRLTGAAL